MRRPLRGAARVTALALCVALAGAGCSGGSEEPEADPPASSSAPAPAFETRARLGKVVGRLPPRGRTPALRAVASVVEGWTDAAFLAGDYPRTTFGSYPGFTPGARQEAVRDAALMSNADIGGRIDEVTPVRRAVSVDLLAHRARAVAATARVVLQFDTAGEVERRVTVRGRLRLTWSAKGKGWRVFAYDMTKGSSR